MKPYIKVLYNKVKFSIIRILRCNDFYLKGIQLFDYDTRIAVDRTSHIRFGEKIVSDGRCTIIVSENATLDIGSKVYMNEGMMISCKSQITIGEGCQFGPGVKIFDNNHLFDREQGVLPEHISKPITIGKNTWIASNVIILKGATIGDNCVIGAGCIIKENIPNSSIVTQENTLKIVPIEDRK